MPRGYPNPKPAPVAPVVAEEPEPMIFIEPGRDGSIRLNAYGLYAGEVVDALRRALIQLHAQRAGVQVISMEVPARAAVVASTPAPSKPKLTKPSRNGSSNFAREMKRELALDQFDEADE